MDSLAVGWRSYFETERGGDVEALADAFPDRRSLVVDLVDLNRFDEDLVRAVFGDPDRALGAGRAALADLAGVDGPVQILVENDPHVCHVTDGYADRLSNLVTVQGVVESVDRRRLSLVTAAYACPACDASVTRRTPGVDGDEPARCPECGWDGAFAFRASRSTFLDARSLTLVPLPGRRGERAADESLSVSLAGDLVDGATVDDHVGITGVLRARDAADSPFFTPYLDAVAVRDERDYDVPTDVASALDAHWG